MTRETMIEMLSETIKVTPKEAQIALEEREWDLFKAAKLLQLEQRKRDKLAAQARRDGEGTLLGAVRSLFARPDRDRLATAAR